ncbi:MAG: helix-turn-helix transcriptional regulator [Phycisphaerales bacterium]|nr:helix-turn-helix transcriptional regulator [Phycisphaerales bacterium]
MGTRPQHTNAYKRLCAMLHTMREEAGLTQRGLAERLRRPHSFVYKVEHAERRIDPVEMIAWCKACESDPTVLVATLAPGIPIYGRSPRTRETRR